MESRYLLTHSQGLDQEQRPQHHSKGKQQIIFETSKIDAKDIKLKEKIGKGMYGVVWLGTCRGQEVAIKKLNTEAFDDTTLLEISFEVQIMTHLHHPNIVLFMGTCLTPGHLSIVTEYCPKGDLYQLIHKAGFKFGFFQKCLMSRDIASGINWLHENNPPIIHRDIKPRNLLVGNNFEIKLCDFGISVYRDSESLREKEKANGTPLWMAPEVLSGKEFTEKCDVYAFGIVVWELFTEMEPFSNHKNLKQFKEAVCDRHERPMINQDMLTTKQLTNDLVTLIRSCWDKEESDRPMMRDIIPQLIKILITNQLLCPDSAFIWNANWPGRHEVSFASFCKVLSRALKTELTSPNIKYFCLEALFYGVNFKSREKTVTLEKFALLLNWFGFIRSPGRIPFPERFSHLMSQKWFYGDLSKKTSEMVLNQTKKNTFLVRFSFSETHKTPFILSKQTSNGIVHQKLYSMKGGQGYYCISKKDNQEIEFAEKGELTEIVKLLMKRDKLVPINGSSPFVHLFNEKPDPLFQ